MSKPRLLLMAALVVVMAGAIASTSASAAKCTPEPRSGCAWIGPLTLVARWTFTSSKPVAAKSAELSSEGLPTVACERATAEGEFASVETGSPAKNFSVVFTACKYTEHSEGCTVKEPITTAPLSGTVTLISEVPDVLFTPESGTLVADIQVTGASCEHATTEAVTGEQLCEAKDLEEELKNHLLTCPKSGSELKNGAKAATLAVEQDVLVLVFAGDDFGFTSNFI